MDQINHQDRCQGIHDMRESMSGDTMDGFPLSPPLHCFWKPRRTSKWTRSSAILRNVDSNLRSERGGSHVCHDAVLTNVGSCGFHSVRGRPVPACARRRSAERTKGTASRVLFSRLRSPSRRHLAGSRQGIRTLRRYVAIVANSWRTGNHCLQSGRGGNQNASAAG